MSDPSRAAPGPADRGTAPRHRVRARRRVETLITALVVAVVTVVVLGAGPTPAHAHSDFVEADPPDGAVLRSAPDRVVFRFSGDIPLDTVSAEYLDDGSPVPLSPLRHGSGGRHEVVASLPPVDGVVTVRWRLVGEDGHVVDGQVVFTVDAAGAAGSDATTVAAPVSSVPGGSTTDRVVGGSVDPVSRTTDGAGASIDAGHPVAGSAAVPGWLRWLCRAVAYLALVALGGLVAVDRAVLPGLLQRPGVRRRAMALVGVIGASAALQVLVLSGDVAGRPPWAALDRIDTALSTDAGVAAAVRTVTCVALVVLLRTAPDRLRKRAVMTSLVVVLLATWTFGGHARSMRWPWLGVPIDIAHQAAAAAWVGGLSAVVCCAVRPPVDDPTGALQVMQRFSRLAGVAVTVVAVTGVLQGMRLVGRPDRLMSSGYGHLLLAKLLLFAVLLWVGAMNRSRVARRVEAGGPVPAGTIRTLRRAMATEFALGAAILAVTAALVSSMPPVAADEQAGASRPTGATAHVGQWAVAGAGSRIGYGTAAYYGPS